MQQIDMGRKEISLKLKRKYLVAVALLAVLAVVFGLAGTVAPLSQPVMPQQESSLDSVTHFAYPPTYDSGWVNITDKCGQYFTLIHGLNTTEAVVDITGKLSLDPLSGTIVWWNRTYGGPNVDCGYSVVQTGDGGYALTGWTDSFGAGGYDAWLVKTDASGTAQWNKTYGGASTDFSYSVVLTVDGGYALASSTDSFGVGARDFWLIKTDADGNALWNQTYGGIDHDELLSAVQTGDGGYALAGYTNSFGAGISDFWLVKTDSTGNHQWNKTYGGPNTDDACSVIQTVDGGYAMAGYKRHSPANYDFWLVKTDSTGNHQWNKTYGGPNIEAAWAVVQTVDGGYALAGYTNSFGAGNSDFWLVKTDSTGNHQWNKTYGGPNTDMLYLGQPIALTVDGGYALAGHTDSFGAGSRDFWLVKTDSAGNMQWNQTYGGTGTDEPHSVIQTSEGGYALAGWTNSLGAGNWDFWLVKVFPDFNMVHQMDLGRSAWFGPMESGLAWFGLTDSTIVLYRGNADPYWNYVRVRIWTIQEPTWQYGDLDMDGDVDPDDFAIFAANYGKTFSLLSLGGIAGILGLQTYKARKEPG